MSNIGKQIATPWSEPDVARLLALVEEKLPWDKIATEMKRTTEACNSKAYEVRGKRNRRPRRAPAHRCDPRPSRAVQAQMDADATAAARIAAAAPRNLTALLCGDPLPGRSALDQRTPAGASVGRHDRRSPSTMRPVTLPTEPFQ